MLSENSEDLIDLTQARAGVRQTLEHLSRIGVSVLPMSNEENVQQLASAWRTPDQATSEIDSTVTPAQPKPASVSRPERTTSTLPLAEPQLDAYTTQTLSLAERVAALDQYRQQVAGCTLCQELAGTRTQTVFGVGNPEARVCYFGEAPGADEDRQGEPFVGRAGQLLTKIIQATKMSRDDVYILNTLKCRPPGNRNPLPDELGHCRPFFEAQLEIIQPEYIVCLGLFAAQSLLDTTLSIGRMRGRFHRYLGSKVVVTYHPAYLLRNEKMKAATWQDLQMMMRDMGSL